MIKLADRYWEYSALLQQAGATFSVSEAHGFFTALHSIQPQAEFEKYSQNLFNGPIDLEDTEVQHCLQALAEIFTQTALDLQQSDLSFSLLLADEDESLAKRVSDFQDWLQGYLFGLGLAGLVVDNPALSNDDSMNEDIKEMLTDMVRIGQVSLEDLTESEDNEQALLDLVSYVYVGVLLIFEAGATVSQSPQ